MIAHQFPISQQAPDPRAADFLELYSALFDTLLGKEQVLLPHCVEVSGANDANLFVNPRGNYVVPITSRTRFVSRPGHGTEAVAVTLRIPDAGKLSWAHAISAEGPYYPARISMHGEELRISADGHDTATMPLIWSVADLPAVTARLEARDTRSGGGRRNRVGSRGAWIPGIDGGESTQNGFHLEILKGEVFRWPAPRGTDFRLLDHPQEPNAQPTCWFASDRLSFRIEPPDPEGYRLTLYVLDYDRDGRALEIALSDDFASLGTERVSVTEMGGGAWLTWIATGTLNVELKKTAGHNAVLSGLFVDPAAEKGKFVPQN